MVSDTPIQISQIELRDSISKAEAKAAVVVKPTVDDLPSLVELVNEYARRGDLLPRTADSILETIDDWVVGKVNSAADGSGGRVIACGSLLSYRPDLAEVRSLAVADVAQGTGLGRKIVEALIREGHRRQIPILFALTRAVGFFLRMGFKITDKEYFPEKVWHDCAICPLRDACDETAVVLNLESDLSGLSK